MNNWQETEQEIVFTFRPAVEMDPETIVNSDINDDVKLISAKPLSANAVEDPIFKSKISFAKSKFTSQQEAQEWLNKNWKDVFGDPLEGKSCVPCNWDETLLEKYRSIINRLIGA